MEPFEVAPQIDANVGLLARTTREPARQLTVQRSQISVLARRRRPASWLQGSPAPPLLVVARDAHGAARLLSNTVRS